MSPNATESPRKLKRDERREAIVSGAAEAFVRHGYEATTLEDVAEAAGVSRALLYRHFDTKQAIYQAVLDHFLDGFRQVMPQSIEDRWAASGTFQGMLHMAQTDPNGFRLFFRHAVREPDFQAYHDELTAKRVDYIDDRLRSDFTDPKQRRFRAELVQELVISTILIWIDNGLPHPDTMPELIRNILKSVTESENK